MKQTLNSLLLKHLKPSQKPQEIWDDRLNGFLLRVQPSGLAIYYVQYARGKRLKLGRADILTPKQARDQAVVILSEAAQGKDPAESRRKKKVDGLTVRQLIDEVYEPWLKNNQKWWKATLKTLRVSFPKLLDCPLIQLNPWLIEQWRSEKLKQGLKRITVNRQFSDLNAMINRAVQWGFLKANPLQSVKPLKSDSNAITRYLTHEEEARLRKALDDRETVIRTERDTANQWRAERGYPLMPNLHYVAFADHLKPLVLLSLNTGLRQGEVFSLTWGDINLDKRFLTVQGNKAKSGKTRHVPLNDEAFAILQGWLSQSVAIDLQSIVFPGKGGGQLDNVTKSWGAVLKKAMINEFRWHDLRHSFASHLVMAGVDLNTVRELLGHASYEMTLRYAHLAPEHKAQAVQQLVTKRQLLTDSAIVANAVNE